MSLLTYNGIALDIVNFVHCHAQNEYQGPDYLWTRYRLRVQAKLNPALSNWNLPGSFAGVAPPAAGSLPGFNPPINTGPAGAGFVGKGPMPLGLVPAVLSHAAIRHMLSIPRQQLTYRVGTTILFQTPPATLTPGTSPFAGPTFLDTLLGIGIPVTIDAHNGPVPRVHAITQVQGVKTINIDWEVEFCLNEWNSLQATPSPLLSNRWSQTADIDKDFYTVITTRGRAQFRSDLLASTTTSVGAATALSGEGGVVPSPGPAGGGVGGGGGFRFVVPDDFRWTLLPPIPPNFQRRNIRSVAVEDNTALEWSCQDVELPMNFGLSVRGLTRIEALQTVSTVTFNVERATLGLGRRVIEKWVAKGSSGAAVDEGGRHRRSMTASAANLFLSEMPLQQLNIIVRAWGNRPATRKQLESLCINIIAQRLSMTVLAGFTAGAKQLNITHDIAGRFVEASMSCVTALAGLEARVFSIDLPATSNFFPDTDDTGTFLLSGGSGTNPAIANTRGSYTNAIAAQALITALSIPIGASPYAPPNPPTPFDATVASP